MKTILIYNNYRQYLLDFYEERKRTTGYSYREFAADTGMNSSSWLLLLIKGKKNLSADTAKRVALALKLTELEKEYFEALVEFNQAKESLKKDAAFVCMTKLRQTSGTESIDEDRYEYYAHWYHPVIRSLVSKIDWNDDFGRLARRVVPIITTKQARDSVRLLLRLGFIRKNDDGSWVQDSPVISTGDEVSSLGVANYHKQVLRLAEDAIDNTKPDQRDISALTMGISESDFLRIKERVQTFRKEIMQIARESQGADRVYQFNLQLFPVSETDVRRGRKK